VAAVAGFGVVAATGFTGVTAKIGLAGAARTCFGAACWATGCLAGT